MRDAATGFDLASLRQNISGPSIFLTPLHPNFRVALALESQTLSGLGMLSSECAVVEANGNPIALKLSEGQAHDGRSVADMLDTVGSGQILLADRAYDSDALRAVMAERGAWANIKPVPRRVNVPVSSLWLYRRRTSSNAFFSKLKHCRAIATRFEKYDANYLALVKLAAV